MLKHPKRGALDSFLKGLDTGAAGLLLHVLHCDECSGYALGSLIPLEHRRGLLALRRSLPEIDYSRLWGRVEAMSVQAVELLRQERADAEPLLEELLRRPQTERLELVRRQARFRSWALADLLLEEARTRPGEREDLARLVLAVASAGPGEHAERAVGDLVAAAQCELAEAARSRGDHAAAEHAFEEAARQLHSSAATLERANFCHLLAALRRDQGRADEALALLDRAADLLEEAGNHHARSAALVEYGFLALEKGEPERALAAFDDATAVTRALSAGLAFRAVKGIALALAFQGRPGEALATLTEARALYGWTPGSAEGLHLLAIEGRLALAAGETRKAKELLTTAFHGFVQRGEPYEACSAAVHLGRALLLDRRPRRELRQLAHQIQPLLASPQIPPEVYATLAALVEEAAGTSQISPRRFQEVGDLLEQPRLAEHGLGENSQEVAAERG